MHLSSNIQEDFEELYGWQRPPMRPEGWIVHHWHEDDLEFSEGEFFQEFEQMFQNFFGGFPFDVTPQIQGLSMIYCFDKTAEESTGNWQTMFPKQLN